MAESIAFFSLKGGVGKTTTVANVAGTLIGQGKRVLVIDMDGQSNLTISLGVNPDDEVAKGKRSIAEFLFAIGTYVGLGQKIFEKHYVEVKSRIESSIVQTKSGIDLIYSAKHSRFQFECVEQLKLENVDRIYLLDYLLAMFDKDYDYILIDTVPLPCYQLDTALASSKRAVCIINLDAFSFLSFLDSIYYLSRNIIEKYDAEVEFLGFVVNDVNLRLSHQDRILNMLKDYRDKYTFNIFESFIPTVSKIAAACVYGVVVTNTSTKEYEKVRNAYTALTDEIISHIVVPR